jgi:SAM-dependent methyltransferase
MTTEDRADVSIPLDRPTAARAYGWLLGGKDNFAIDRELTFQILEGFPEALDVARENRKFLYRAVRFLVEEVGISQFLDLGCGLPTNQNVHQVAQKFNPDARVVYVDNDPIVLAHGRALLADNDNTTVITADFREPEAVLEHEETKRLIDFSQPLAILFLSIGHHLKDVDDVGKGARYALRHIIDDIAVPGSCLAVTQVACDDPALGAVMNEQFNAAGIPWQTRTPAEFDELMAGLEPVEPGLVDIKHWRPDPNQPELDPVPPELYQYVGAAERNKNIYEYGGVLRKP